MKVKEVAEMLNISQNTLRLGLQQGVFPFGCAVKTSGRYTYVFYPEKLEEYIGKERRCGSH